MRQFLALFIAAVFTVSLAGVAVAQGTQTPPAGSPAAGSPPPSPSGSASGSSGSTTDTTKSTAPSGSATDPSATGAGKSTTGAAAPEKGKMGTKGQAGAAGGMRGQHRMMGEVTKVDSSKGMLTLKTDEGDLDLHFPPSALQGVKEGDRVEVTLGIRPASGSAGKAGASTDKTGAAKSPGSAAKSGAAGGPQPKTQ